MGSFNEMLDFLKKLSDQSFIALVAAAVGAAGFLNVVDAIIFQYLGEVWTRIPDWLRQIFEVIRMVWRPLFDLVGQYFPFNVSGAAKDYFLMGFIVVGMRWRSSWVIWNALNDNVWDEYPQKMLWMNKKINLKKNQKLKYYFAFLPIRLIPTFFFWPIRVIGAALRYVNGQWSIGYEGKAREVREQQYITFFTTIFLAILFILLCLLFF